MTFFEAMAAANPAFAAALEQARAVADREVSVSCPYGRCQLGVDPLTNRVTGGVGPIDCPCEHLAGWNNPFLVGRSKPAAPVKAVGRHGSRVARSQNRHTLPDWIIQLSR